MDIKSLLDLTCKTVAKRIVQCRTPEAIRKEFGIEDDLPPEVKAQLEYENTWADRQP